MKTSPQGRAAIVQREGVRLKPYYDSVGVLTIGIGHTSAAGDPKVVRGMSITRGEAESILTRDLAKYERTVLKAVKVQLTQNQFDALVSLCFNIGQGAFSKSTLVKRLNAGDVAEAADQFLVWNKGTVNGRRVVIAGLASRRRKERAQFLSGSQVPAKPKSAPTATPAPRMGFWASIAAFFAKLFRGGK